MICKYIIKRKGNKVDFDDAKLYRGILTAIENSDLASADSSALADKVYAEICRILDDLGFDCVTAVDMQRYAVEALNHLGGSASEVFLKYANKRKEIREMMKLKGTLSDITSTPTQDLDIKRENANIDGNTAMGTMLRYGSESAKSYNLSECMDEDIAEAHRSGDIHIHDLDFYSLTETCCQINLSSVFKGGFSTGHGYIREPGSIKSAAALACIVIQSNQNDQHGGQSVPCFDYYLAPYVTKTLMKEIKRCLSDSLELLTGSTSKVVAVLDKAREFTKTGKSIFNDDNRVEFAESIADDLGIQVSVCSKILKRAVNYTEREAYQAMESLVANLNTMNSRAGAQVPFSSINFGTDISPEGRCVSRNLMTAIYEGLGNGETAIFPITIFKVKSGVNFEKGTPNYDLYQQALRTTAKRLFPNFSFIDAPFNLQYYKPGHPETEVAYMGCRTRVMGNVYDSSREITEGRGNLSFTTINLPRLGIKCRGDLDKFYSMLDEKLELVKRQLLARFEIQSNKTVRNYPFLMGQGVWIDSDKLYPDDKVGDVLKHGTLTIGFIGLAECLVALHGKHHGESEVAQRIGLNIIRHMREYTDRLCVETGLNWSVIATPAEGLAGRFVALDKKLFGEIKGVTDKEWYTNSFHVPVEYDISVFEKLKIEGPYHNLTNGGHISYVEVDGDPSSNIEAMDQIVHGMYKSGVGYGAINHPVDRDPACGYLGVIGDYCPMCRRKDGDMASVDILKKIKQLPENAILTPKERGKSVKIERIRRITGYLVGTVDRFNNAKRQELEHRVKHL